jgi:hypothetical protein
MDNLIQESESQQSETSPSKNSQDIVRTASSASFQINDDMKVLIENYEKCCKKLNDLNQNAHIKDERNKLEREVLSDVDCIELKLKYLSEKRNQLGKLEKTAQMSCSAFLDKLINEYQVSEALTLFFVSHI